MCCVSRFFFGELTVGVVIVKGMKAKCKAVNCEETFTLKLRILTQDRLILNLVLSFLYQRLFHIEILVIVLQKLQLQL